jgi:hypothetical protein
MKYLWTEDTGAGLHFWQLINQLLKPGSTVAMQLEIGALSFLSGKIGGS